MLGQELSTPVFTILSSYIEEKVGITYSPRDRELLQDKAYMRTQELGFESFLDYYYYLRYDDHGEKELSELVEALVVNETYFFREWSSIQTLVHSFIVPMCAAGKRPRIWSAACATGEEPLTLAMVLDDLNLLDQVDIVASDISARVLNKAQSGIFSKRAVRSVPDQKLCDKYLTLVDGKYQILPRLVQAIKWQRKNLTDPAQLQELGVFDAILCRNVLIYFSDQVVRNVLGNLSRSLCAEGILIIGISESLLRYPGQFTGEERAGTFIYTKVVQS